MPRCLNRKCPNSCPFTGFCTKCLAAAEYPVPDITGAFTEDSPLIENRRIPAAESAVHIILSAKFVGDEN